MDMIINSKSPQQTTSLGLKLAKKAKGGQIYSLIGDLGSGKTHFTKGFAKGLEIKSTITSPSFILMKVYKINKGKIKYFCHVDAYRLKQPQEIIEVGLKEYLDRKNTITVVEWADKIKKILNPYQQQIITFLFVDKNIRQIKIK